MNLYSKGYEMAKGILGRFFDRLFGNKEVTIRETPTQEAPRPSPPPPPQFPEFPEQRSGGPGRGREYWQEQVVNRKEEIWGDSGRYNPQRAARYVRNGVDKNNPNPPSIALLQWAATAPEDELQMAIRSGDSDYAFLFYK